MTGKIMWRAEFYENKKDKTPTRTVYINAKSEGFAAKKAAKKMGDCMRVDLVRTILAKAPKSN